MNPVYSDQLYNVLPYDGEVHYYGVVLDILKARDYFDQLVDTIHWEHDEVMMFGKRIVTSRKVAWYGDDAYAYTYSKMTKKARRWTTALSRLKTLIENIVNVEFNSCLLNLYHNGKEGVGWHSDNEKSLGCKAAIASLSLGAERKFLFKHKTTEHAAGVLLENGSLLLMKGETQNYWLHRLPPNRLITLPRISLTFRTIVS